MVIANYRIRSVAHGVVRFAYRHSADHHQRKEMTLPASEFLRRGGLRPRGRRTTRGMSLRAGWRKTPLTLARFGDGGQTGNFIAFDAEMG